MSRRKKTGAEIVPVSEAVLLPAVSREPGANLKAAIEQMVRGRVDEILSATGVEMEPSDFRPVEDAKEARRVESMFERKKWVLYFERWGCRACGKKTVSHASTGHCDRCALRLYARLKRIKREYEAAHPEARIERQIGELTLRARAAEDLLLGFRVDAK